MICRLSVTVVSHAKIAEPIEMPFGSRACVGTMDPDPPWEGGKGQPIVKYRDTLR